MESIIDSIKSLDKITVHNPFFSHLYSTVQGFFHQPAHPRREGATIKRISPPRKPPAGGDCGGSAAFPRWVLQIKIDR